MAHMLFSVAISALALAAPQSKPLWIQGARVLAPDGRAWREAAVLVRDGRIAEVLIDLHTHLLLHPLVLVVQEGRLVFDRRSQR